jgi:hypothetical protein
MTDNENDMDNQLSLSKSSQCSIAKLPGAWLLLKEAWGIYKRKVSIFLGVVIVPLIVNLAIIFFTKTGGSLWGSKILQFPPFLVALFSVFAALIFIFDIILPLWATVTLIYIVRERKRKVGLKEAYRFGWSKLWSYLGIIALSFFVVFGAVGLLWLVFGFIIFGLKVGSPFWISLSFIVSILPGLVLTVSLILSSYVLVAENKRGLNALLASSAYVKNRWVQVFWRFFVIGVIIFIVALITRTNLILSNFAFLIIMPFAVTYAFLIYENLKKLKSEINLERGKRRLKTLAIIGVVIVLAVLAIRVLGIIQNNLDFNRYNLFS